MLSVMNFGNHHKQMETRLILITAVSLDERLLMSVMFSLAVLLSADPCVA